MAEDKINEHLDENDEIVTAQISYAQGFSQANILFYVTGTDCGFTVATYCTSIHTVSSLWT